MAHIPDSINIPEEKLKEMIETGKPFSKNQKILLVCPGGRKSKKYATLLQREGFEAFSLKKGLNGWRDQGLNLKQN
jgi:rhodanese-related sulfurtransferase